MKNCKTILDKLFQRTDENLVKSETRFAFVKTFFDDMTIEIKSKVILKNHLHQFEVSNKIVHDG